MPITTPDKIDDKRYSPENIDAPVIEFDGREMTTVEALQIADHSHQEFWKLIEQLEDKVEEKDRRIQELADTVRSLQERVEELEGDEDYRCPNCAVLMSPELKPSECPGCGKKLAWEEL